MKLSNEALLFIGRLSKQPALHKKRARLIELVRNATYPKTRAKHQAALDEVNALLGLTAYGAPDPKGLECPLPKAVRP